MIKATVINGVKSYFSVSKTWPPQDLTLASPCEGCKDRQFNKVPQFPRKAA